MKALITKLFCGQRSRSRQKPSTRIRRVSHLAVEPLEAREVPAAINFSFDPADLTGWSNPLTTSQQAALLTDLQTAGQEWSRKISAANSSPVTLSVKVYGQPDSVISGGTAFSALMRAASTTSASVTSGGVYEPGAEYESRTGIDNNGASADIELYLNSDFIANTSYWSTHTGLTAFFDNASRTSTFPGGNNVDVISDLEHELGHALGMQTHYVYATGVLQPSQVTTKYDTYLTGTGTGRSFSGSNAIAVNGGAVTLAGTHGLDHTGFSTNDVMYYQGPPVNGRWYIGNIDVAIMSDLGYVRNPSVISTSVEGKHGQTFVLDSQNLLWVYTDNVGWVFSGITAKAGTTISVGTDAAGTHDTVAVIIPSGTLSVWTQSTGAYYGTSEVPAAGTAVLQGKGETFYVKSATLWRFVNTGTPVTSSIGVNSAANSFSVGTDASGNNSVAIVTPTGTLSVWVPALGSYTASTEVPTAGTVKQGKGETFYIKSGQLWRHINSSNTAVSSSLAVLSFSVGTDASGTNNAVGIVLSGGTLSVWIPAPGTYYATGYSVDSGTSVKQSNGETYYVQGGKLWRYYNGGGAPYNSTISVSSNNYSLGSNSSSQSELSVIGATGVLSIWNPWTGSYVIAN